MFLYFDNSSEEAKELGSFKKTLSFKLEISGVFSLVTLSKFDFEDESSVFALIKFALAPAKDDSD